VTTETSSLPAIVIRGRSFMALIVSPELPLENWFETLDQQMQRSAGFFADRPVIANLAAALGAEESAEAILDALDERRLRIIGIEGIDPALLAGTRWERLPRLSQGRDAARADRPVTIPDDPSPTSTPASLPSASSLLIDRPVRSGQSIIFENGDITVIGSVASGAEIIAGGSVHVYGALRGRAIAGLRAGAAARIFCQKLVAELVAIDGLYYTPEHWGEGLHGRAVQIRLDQGTLKLSALG
jgi:septum site-determining protein MinC